MRERLIALLQACAAIAATFFIAGLVGKLTVAWMSNVTLIALWLVVTALLLFRVVESRMVAAGRYGFLWRYRSW